MTDVRPPQDDDLSWLNDPAKSLVPVQTSDKPKSARKSPVPEAKKRKAAKTPEQKLADELENAPEVAAPEPNADPPPAATPPAAAAGRRRSGRKHGEIFDNCPVTPLGVRDGYSYYLDTWGQLRGLGKHEIQAMKALFGKDIPALWRAFPKWRKVDDDYQKIDGVFDADKASTAMYMACSEQGLFNPDNAVRGVGAWQTEDGELVYHMGDKLLIGGKTEQPGRHGRHIYPAYPSIPAPAPEDHAENPVPELLKLLTTWNWQRPDLDPMVVLGLICVQMLGGALDWRPVFWITGGAGAGKSALQQLITMLHGQDGVISSEDPTKSGITSRLGHSSLPVCLDEREPDTDERSSKNSDIIALARIAASGGEWLRGSSDQTGSRGKVFSAFLFSSILIPGSMKPQDVQRLIQLNLNRLPEDAAPLDLQTPVWRAHGAALKRRLIDRWPTFARRKSIWRKALAGVGIHGRDADNWEVTIAMADMAMNASMPDTDDTDYWCRLISSAWTQTRADVTDDAEAMLLHLKTQVLDLNRRGDNYTVAEWIMVAAGLPAAPESLLPLNNDPLPQEKQARRSKANETLARIGLRVVGERENAVLFIANAKITGLNEMFKGTDWAGGSWRQSALRIEGASVCSVPKRLKGTSTRGVNIPISSINGMMSFPLDRTGRDTATPQPPATDMDDFV